MSEVKRFGYFWDGSFDVKDDGAFIRYEDYAELKAELDALAAENEQLRNINSLCAELADGLLSEEDAASFAAQLRAGKDGE